MKKVVLYSFRSEVGETYMRDLKALFSGQLELRLFTLGAPPTPGDETGRPADIALITNPEQVPHVRHQLHPGTNIISVDFSYSLKNIEQLKTYPDATRGKLLTSFPTVRKNLIRLFYEQGVNNIVWIEDEAGAPFDLLVVDDLSPSPLPPARQVTHLGRRKLSFSTLLQVATSAGILDPQLERRLFQYTEGYRGSLSIFPFLYSDLSSSHSQLLAVLNGIDDAVAIFDRSLRLVQCNASFVALFPNAEEARGMPLEELPQMNFLLPVLRSETPVKNRLLSGGRRGDLVVCAEQIAPGLESAIRHILIVQRLQEVESRDREVRHQLAQKGYRARYRFDDIKSASPQMEQCLQKARIIAGIDKTTLIEGESGVGKELLVQAIHSASSRSRYPFVSINCAALPASLLESELFGYSEGAFTGSKRGGKRGLFELAHRGTLFLDEIGETSPEVQSKLLRAIETKELMPVGGDSITTVDVRIIAATNQNLRELVRQKKFRLDLYYRLNTIVLRIPPLRQRKEDILMLANHFIRLETGSSREMTSGLLSFLLGCHWEGNVRELRNVVEYMVNITAGTLGLEHLPDYALEALPEMAVPVENSPARSEAIAPLLEQYGRAELRLLRRLLTLIREGCHSRGALLDRLALEGERCSAYRLRNYLATLQAAGYLDYGKGPRGIFLLPAGVELLNEAPV